MHKITIRRCSSGLAFGIFISLLILGILLQAIPLAGALFLILGPSAYGIFLVVAAVGAIAGLIVCKDLYDWPWLKILTIALIGWPTAILGPMWLKELMMYRFAYDIPIYFEADRVETETAILPIDQTLGTISVVFRAKTTKEHLVEQYRNYFNNDGWMLFTPVGEPAHVRRLHGEIEFYKGQPYYALRKGSYRVILLAFGCDRGNGEGYSCIRITRLEV